MSMEIDPKMLSTGFKEQVNEAMANGAAGVADKQEDYEALAKMLAGIDHEKDPEAKTKEAYIKEKMDEYVNKFKLSDLRNRAKDFTKTFVDKIKNLYTEENYNNHPEKDDNEPKIIRYKDGGYKMISYENSDGTGVWKTYISDELYEIVEKTADGITKRKEYYDGKLDGVEISKYDDKGNEYTTKFDKTGKTKLSVTTRYANHKLYSGRTVYYDESDQKRVKEEYVDKHNHVVKEIYYENNEQSSVVERSYSGNIVTETRTWTRNQQRRIGTDVFNVNKEITEFYIDSNEFNGQGEVKKVTKILNDGRQFVAEYNPDNSSKLTYPDGAVSYCDKKGHPTKIVLPDGQNINIEFNEDKSYVETKFGKKYFYDRKGNLLKTETIKGPKKSIVQRADELDKKLAPVLHTPIIQQAKNIADKFENRSAVQICDEFDKKLDHTLHTPIIELAKENRTKRQNAREAERKKREMEEAIERRREQAEVKSRGAAPGTYYAGYQAGMLH